MADAFDAKPQSGLIKSIQRGVNNTSVTLSPPVNPAKTEVRWLGGMTTSGGAFADIPRLQLISKTTLSISFSSGVGSVNWEITERY